MVLGWWIHVIIHLSKPVECATREVNPDVNSGLWVTACWCRFADGNRCAFQMGDAVWRWGGGCGLWTAVISTQLYCDLKTSLRNRVHVKKKKKCQYLSKVPALVNNGSLIPNTLFFTFVLSCPIVVFHTLTDGESMMWALILFSR